MVLVGTSSSPIAISRGLEALCVRHKERFNGLPSSYIIDSPPPVLVGGPAQRLAAEQPLAACRVFDINELLSRADTSGDEGEAECKAFWQLNGLPCSKAPMDFARDNCSDGSAATRLSIATGLRAAFVLWETSFEAQSSRTSGLPDPSSIAAAAAAPSGPVPGRRAAEPRNSKGGAVEGSAAKPRGTGRRGAREGDAATSAPTSASLLHPGGKLTNGDGDRGD
mmetsp:Transcript_151623/g.486546  ORF Transcript_151623/g.486546 Transcript_151623/m.486546 type:complete len:223 (+) Transcript_151623:207-875(+)